LFEKAIEYEKNHKDGRDYTWTQGETLEELLARKDEIIEKHRVQTKTMQHKQMADKDLSTALEPIFDETEDSLPCILCQI
jgi:hypothetical protein